VICKYLFPVLAAEVTHEGFLSKFDCWSLLLSQTFFYLIQICNGCLAGVPPPLRRLHLRRCVSSATPTRVPCNGPV
jgi:hypothetical protein